MAPVIGATTAELVAACVILGAAEELVAGCMTARAASAAELVAGCMTVGAAAAIFLSHGLSIYRIISRSSRQSYSMIVHLVTLTEYQITSGTRTKM